MYRVGLKAFQKGYQVKHFAEVSSTNAEAMQYGILHPQSKTWFVADTQTAGKGRRGRVWQTLHGNLAASLIVGETSHLQSVGQLSYLCAVALSQVLSVFITPERIQLKWPNDVLVDNKKVAGILIETALVPASMKHVIICGIGVNCSQSPEESIFPATSLRESGTVLGSHEFFTCLSDCMASLLGVWQEGAGFSDVRHMWLEHAFRLGQRITVRQNHGEMSGIFETINEDGCLMLSRDDGSTIAITYGDVS